MAITIPEIVLFNTIKNLLKFIRADYAANIADTTQSYLYKVLIGNNVQRYDLFTQAETVFITPNDDPRHLDVNMFFNAKRAAIPTIHITLPSEGEKDNVIANGEGYRDPVYNDDDTLSTTIFNRRFAARYNIIITSDNTNEVILIYSLVRSAFISLNAHFSLAGLQQPKLSGGDLNINSEIVPPNVFVRSIGLDFSYDVEGIELFPGVVWPFDLISVNSIINIPVTNNITPIP
jgi:hypothetical protein